MSSAVNLLQVLLPDSISILSASTASHTATAADVIHSLLVDPANAGSLYSVFGSNYDPACFSPTDGVQDAGAWWIDAKGMPWAIQTVEVCPANKEWQQDELECLGDGLLPLSTPIFPLLHALLAPNADGALKSSHASLYAANHGLLEGPAQSGFSDFALSSHLHTPRLRLVCGAPGLAVRLRFAHVPEIYDGWDGRVFFVPAPWDGVGPASGSGTRVSEAVEAICEELGVRRVVLQGSKSARVEYALADILTSQISMPPPPPLSSKVCLPEHLATLPGPPDAYPMLYFTISANWLSRLGTVALGFSKHSRKSVKPFSVPSPRVDAAQGQDAKIASPKPAAGMFGLWGGASLSKATASAITSLTTGDNELDALAKELPNTIDDESETGGTGGTVKGNVVASSADQDTAAPKEPDTQRAKKSPQTHTATARLSRMFEGWVGNTPADVSAESPVTPSPGPKARPSPRVLSVSGPLELDGYNGNKSASSPLSPRVEWLSCGEADDEALEVRFEQLMNELGIKGASRKAMLALPDDRKRFLIAQNEAAKTTPSKTKTLSPQSTGQTSGSDGAGGFTDTLSRASTALAWGNRFSIANLAGWSGEETATAATSSPTASSSERESYPPSSKTTSMTTDSGEGYDAVKANVTGASASLWANWWGNTSEAVEKDDPAYYPRLISSSKLSRKELVKTLISLRVTLSSAKLVWISAFLDEQGLEALERLLRVETLPFANGQMGDIKEMSDVVLSESVKCLRTLMNTEVSQICGEKLAF